MSKVTTTAKKKMKTATVTEQLFNNINYIFLVFLYINFVRRKKK